MGNTVWCPINVSCHRYSTSSRRVSTFDLFPWVYCKSEGLVKISTEQSSQNHACDAESLVQDWLLVGEDAGSN